MSTHRLQSISQRRNPCAQLGRKLQLRPIGFLSTQTQDAAKEWLHRHSPSPI